MPLLSVCVCSLADRQPLLARLSGVLTPQLQDADAEMLVLADAGAETIGRKRNRLLAEARGRYVAFVDDDDLVPPDYCRRVAAALRPAGVDVVGFWLRQYDNGAPAAYALHSVRCNGWGQAPGLHAGLPLYLRTPNHLNPVRTEYARAVGYKSVNNGEDADYSVRLRAAYPALRETLLPQPPLYFYLRRDAAARAGERRNNAP